MTPSKESKSRTRSLIRLLLSSYKGAHTASWIWNTLRDKGHGVSPSGVRSRLAEMVRDGEVDVADRFGTTESGNRCMRYRLHRESRVLDRNGNPM